LIFKGHYNFKAFSSKLRKTFPVSCKSEQFNDPSRLQNFCDKAIIAPLNLSGRGLPTVIAIYSDEGPSYQ
jgi:hypothetical protein